MTKKKRKSVKTVKDLKTQQMTKMFDLNFMMSEDIVTYMKETFINMAKSSGEEHIEEVFDTVLKAIEKIKNPEFKVIIASIILAKCPIGAQKNCLEEHSELLRTAVIAHLLGVD